MNSQFSPADLALALWFVVLFGTFFGFAAVLFSF